MEAALLHHWTLTLQVQDEQCWDVPVGFMSSSSDTNEVLEELIGDANASALLPLLARMGALPAQQRIGSQH